MRRVAVFGDIVSCFFRSATSDEDIGIGLGRGVMRRLGYSFMKGARVEKVDLVDLVTCCCFANPVGDSSI